MRSKSGSISADATWILRVALRSCELVGARALVRRRPLLIARFAKVLLLCMPAAAAQACGGLSADPAGAPPRISAEEDDTRAGAGDAPVASDPIAAAAPAASGSMGDCPEPPAFALGSGERVPLPECPNLNGSAERQCAQDCLGTCGFQEMGLRRCRCESGIYALCPCSRPAEYLGAATAPYCDTSDNTSFELDGMPCDTEWQQCVSTDPVTGSTPRGCACLVDRQTCALRWFCQSTNQWFQPEPGAFPKLCATQPDDPRCAAAPR